MKDYEIQSIVSLLERSAKALENPNTPADVLMKLAESGNSVVRKNAAKNQVQRSF